MATVRIPGPLREAAGGAELVTASGSTLREVVDDLERQFPGMRERLVEDGAVHSGITLAIGPNQTNDLDAAVADEDEINVLPAISGG